MYQKLMQEAAQIQDNTSSLERDISILARQVLGGEPGVEEALQELEARTRCLADLRARMSDVEVQVLALLKDWPSLAAFGKGKASLCFAEARPFIEKYADDPLNLVRIPQHKHWVPKDVLSKHPDFEGAAHAPWQLGGRVVNLETGPAYLGSVECILVEPMGKYLNPDSFVSAGVVVCFHGLPFYDDVFSEWSKVLKSTKLLDSGFTFAMPEVQASAAVTSDDLQEVLIALLTTVSASNCILIGQGWGGPKVAQVTAEASGLLCGKISGIVLCAPDLPVPDEACEDLDAPVLVVWAENDPTFQENAECWHIALSTSPATVCWACPQTGGSNLSQIMSEEPALAEMVRWFTASLHILSTLARFLKPKAKGKNLDDRRRTPRASSQPVSEAHSRFRMMLRTQTIDELQARVSDRTAARFFSSPSCRAAEAPQDTFTLPAVVLSLCEDLPGYLACQLEQDPELGFADAVENVCRQSDSGRGACSVGVVLRSWLSSGMRVVSASKE